MDYNKKKILYQDVLGNSDTVESYVINTPEDLEQVFSDNNILSFGSNGTYAPYDKRSSTNTE